jgi:hypothetical protein
MRKRNHLNANNKNFSTKIDLGSYPDEVGSWGIPVSILKHIWKVHE